MTTTKFLNGERYDDWILRITMTNATTPHIVKLAHMASAPRSLPIQGCSRGLNVAGGTATSGSAARDQRNRIHAPDAAAGDRRSLT
jgi:hypothetical protein